MAQLKIEPLSRFLEYDPGYVAPAREALRLLGFEAGDPARRCPGSPTSSAKSSATLCPLLEPWPVSF
jgi:hypothetical protein